MPLLFPQVVDVPLARPPLKEVICQVRFPPILSIGRDQPVEFQEAVRTRFPELTEEQNVQIRVTGAPGNPAAQAETAGRVFHFHSAQEDSQVSLAVDAYAISTTHYQVWTDFARDITLVHEAALAAYRIPYAKRIGLRYVNHFDAASTGCQTFEELRGLLRPELSALMVTDAWERPGELVSQVLLDDDGRRLIMRVAARVPDGQPPIILLDLDYYEEEQSIPLHDLIERLTRFHDVIYRAFRWSVQADSLDKFAPRIPGVEE